MTADSWLTAIGPAVCAVIVAGVVVLVAAIIRSRARIREQADALCTTGSPHVWVSWRTPSGRSRVASRCSACGLAIEENRSMIGTRSCPAYAADTPCPDGRAHRCHHAPRHDGAHACRCGQDWPAVTL